MLSTVDGPSSAALSHEVSLAELSTNSGTQFDPDVVEALVRVIEPAAQAAPAIKDDEPRAALPGAAVAIPS